MLFCNRMSTWSCFMNRSFDGGRDWGVGKAPGWQEAFLVLFCFLLNFILFYLHLFLHYLIYRKLFYIYINAVGNNRNDERERKLRKPVTSTQRNVWDVVKQPEMARVGNWGKKRRLWRLGSTSWCHLATDERTSLRAATVELARCHIS